MNKLTTRFRSPASHSPYPALSRSRSRSEVAIRLRSLAHTHQREWRSSHDFSRSSWIDHGRPRHVPVSTHRPTFATSQYDSRTHRTQYRKQVCSMLGDPGGKIPKVHDWDSGSASRVPQAPQAWAAGTSKHLAGTWARCGESQTLRGICSDRVHAQRQRPLSRNSSIGWASGLGGNGGMAQGTEGAIRTAGGPQAAE